MRVGTTAFFAEDARTPPFRNASAWNLNCAYLENHFDLIPARCRM